MENCTDRESYSMAAGLALGNVMLGVSDTNLISQHIDILKYDNLIVDYKRKIFIESFFKNLIDFNGIDELMMFIPVR